MRRGPVPARAGATLLVHDLKSLAGRLAALRHNLQERFEDPHFRRSAAGVLDDTVSHLKRLASDLHDREGAVLVKLRVDLNEVVEAALLDTRPDLSGQVEVMAQFSEVPQVWGDRFLLRQAFACAIENALEALGGKGALAVCTSVTRRGGRPAIVVEIADTGPGMSEATMRRTLFTPFASTKGDGLGLGVYTMSQVAAMHGARLRILSAVGAGTRVRFRFPVEAR